MNKYILKVDGEIVSVTDKISVAKLRQKEQQEQHPEANVEIVLKEERSRKNRQNGAKSQKMMSFRLDYELVDWLASVGNKGRLINRLLKREMIAARNRGEWDSGDPSTENTIIDRKP